MWLVNAQIDLDVREGEKEVLDKDQIDYLIAFMNAGLVGIAIH